jgi:hypothetical protein
MKLKNIVFLVSGASFLILIGVIKYLTGQDMGFLSAILIFLYGGLVGITAITEHTNFLKNLLFASVFGFIIWTIFAPAESVGNNLIIKKSEFFFIFALAVAFLEREVLNTIREALNQKKKLAMGFIGSMLILWWLVNTDMYLDWMKYLAQHYWIIIIFLLCWFTFLFFMLGRQLFRIAKLLKKNIRW